MLHSRFFLSLLCVPVATSALWAVQPDTSKADEATLKAAQIGTDGPGLLEFLSKKTLDDADREKIAALVANLGAEDYDLREKASKALLKLGPKGLPQLRQATRSHDFEVVHRAEDCLLRINATHGPAVTVAAVRLLALRDPEGTTTALLRFVPFADDEYVLETVRDALSATATSEGKPSAVLTEALHAKLPLRRGLAAEALIRAGQASAVPELRKLLEDPDRLVRLRIGLAFVDSKDKTPIPTLIDLLAELPRDATGGVEEILCRIALEKAPAVPLGDTDEARKKCRAAWKDWWDKNGGAIDLAKIDLGERLLGYTLIASIDINTGMGRVLERDKGGKVRWQIDGLMLPMDAQVLGHDRVLITDYRARKVTERNFKGEVLWEKSVPNWPVCSQRLATGNTVIFSRNQILEVDASGKEVITINRPGFDILSGQRLKDGNFLLVSRNGHLIQLDSEGKELKSIPVPVAPVIGGNVEITPEGHYLLPNYTSNLVNEIDSTGKVVKEFKVTQPTCVSRLPNGGLLVGSIYTRQVFEIDRDGKQLSSSDNEGQVYRIRRR